MNATTLPNFIDTELEAKLAPFAEQRVKVGLMGVWTEAKITFLAYDLRARYPNFELAVCSALTASSSRENHFLALDQMERILGVRVIDSVAEFVDYLGGHLEDAPLIGFSERHPTLLFRAGTILSAVDQQLVRYLFRGCREVSLRSLDGGFSGNAVLGATSVDLHGHDESPHVVKIGAAGPIGQERTAFELMRLAVCEARLDAWRPWVDAFLDALQAECVRVAPERHDQAMALIQAMVHATHLAEAGVLRDYAALLGAPADLLPLRTASFELDVAMAARMRRRASRT